MKLIGGGYEIRGAYEMDGGAMKLLGGGAMKLIGGGFEIDRRGL